MIDLKLNNNKKLKAYSCIFIIFFIIIVLLQIFNKHLTIQINNKDKNKRSNYIYDLNDIEIVDRKVNEKIIKLQQVQKINSDIVALIEINGTNINYPVLQTDNNSYYINHNYKREKDKEGAIFLDKDYNWELPSSNLLIYGHNNIGSNEMFSELIKYKKESFYKKHKIINFITNDEEAKYEIISVFLSKAYYKNETDVFRYYNFVNAVNKEDFDNYIINCKRASLYKIDITAEYGDKLMTLSTCEYSRLNGRLAVVAKKIGSIA